MSWILFIISGVIVIFGSPEHKWFITYVRVAMLKFQNPKTHDKRKWRWWIPKNNT